PARLEHIAACSPRLEALILGFVDLSASQGVRLALAAGYPGDLWHFARARVVVAARACGLDAIDGPFANFHDPESYRREATWASTLGFVGKWAIHPSQIEVANDVFAPTAQEIALARRMCAAGDECTVWNGRRPIERGSVLLEIALCLRERQKQLAALEILETGTPAWQAPLEVEVAAQ